MQASLKGTRLYNIVVTLIKFLLQKSIAYTNHAYRLCERK